MTEIQQRVSVVDKRIFQGKADVNALLPLRYPWAYDAYLEANKNQWMPGDIHQDLDRVDHRAQPYWPALNTYLINVANRAEVTRQDMLFIYRATTAPEVRQRFLRFGQEDTLAIVLAQELQLELKEFIPSDEVVDLNTPIAYLNALLGLTYRKLNSVAEGKYLLEEVSSIPMHIRKTVEFTHRDLDSQLDFLFTLMRTFLDEAEPKLGTKANAQVFWNSSNPYHAHLNSVVLNILTGAPIAPSPYGRREVMDSQTQDTLTWD